MSSDPYDTLRGNVSAMGRMLGEIISEAEGAEFLDKIEQIRLLSKSARSGDAGDRQALTELLCNLSREQLVPVARAFSQFLNLANLADQHYTIARETDELFSATQTLNNAYTQLSERGATRQQLFEVTRDLNIELVLTAHPTEITRRSLIDKYTEIDGCLAQLELSGTTAREQQKTTQRLRELITQMWFTYDFRVERPTPIDEAKWGFAVVEKSLWKALPDYMRRLDDAFSKATGAQLPLDAVPVKFASWMGGDRDGNPNVTATVTREVLLLSRWKALDLYINDVQKLIEELSMSSCNAALRAQVGPSHEPYRELLRPLRQQLRNSRDNINRVLDGDKPLPADSIESEQQLLEPLTLCYQSLVESGMELIANSELLDVLRRVRCFGLHLVRHDIRQESNRHAEVFAELVDYLELGDYNAWSESEKQAFLLAELASKRPLLPHNWHPSAAVKEVLDTFCVIAEQPATALRCYIISMARQPSDILAVQLLLRATGCQFELPVAPLFETLDDLNRSAEVVSTLLQVPGYSDQIKQQLMVMIGYSDSAKDAGVMAAAWAQYRAQEELLAVCAEHKVELTLFHGRGGTIGRGGAPARDALLSQPPGSLKNGLRVTEQGEMIRAKLGLSPIAIKTLALYTSAIFEANLMAPPKPKQAWREAMQSLSELSCEHYRAVVRHDPEFVPYFRMATPEQELAKLPLGSRPARRAGSGGIESLRAIPWIFAWSQNRLMLPAWLGAASAMQALIEQGRADQLADMAAHWPFFETRLSMLEMVFAKADAGLSAFYDERLVPTELHPIGERLRKQLAADTQTILQLSGADQLIDDHPWSRESIALRNIYTDPLTVLQAELLRRNREQSDPLIEQAIMVTIAGIAAGMRNTG